MRKYDEEFYIPREMEEAICEKHQCQVDDIEETSGLELGTTYERGQDFEMYYKLRSDLSEDPWTGCAYWSADGQCASA